MDVHNELNVSVTLQCVPAYHSNWLPPGWQLVVDKPKITNVLEHLISNAVKFSPVNGQVIVILEENRSKPNNDDSCSSFIRISVMDTGHGISPENLKKLLVQYAIFDSEVAQRGGRASGLGLWLSKSKCTVLYSQLYAGVYCR